MEECEVLVLGAGVAGLTAATTCARLGRQTLVLCPGGPGGALLSVEQIEDFPGFIEPVAGYELVPSLYEQAAASGAMFAPDAITGVERRAESLWVAQTQGGEVAALAVIAATGSLPGRLGLAGEERFEGRGLSHCASCDGPLVAGRRVAVVGNGDAAMHEALALARYGCRVVMVVEGDDLVGQATYRQRISEAEEITVRPSLTVQELAGDAVLSGIRAGTSDGRVEELSFDALFAYPSRLASTSYLDDVVACSPDGFIVTDQVMRTSAAGLFAAGDVRAGSSERAAAAAGDGVVAATSAAAYLDARA